MPRILKLLLLLFLALSLSAQERSWRIQNFHSDITVHKDGSADVAEHLTMLFNGTYHGIDRFIPTDYPNKKTGGNYSIDLSVKGVTDENGSKLKFDDKSSGGYERLRIYIPGAADTTQTVVIRYSAAAASRFFKDYDEFYWNVTGNDWRVPIDAASATVQLPSAAHDLRAQAFTGAYGSRGSDAKANISGSTVQFESNNLLSEREGLTIDIALPKGVLHEPSAVTHAFRFARANSILWLPVWTFLVMFAVKRKKGSSAEAGLAVAPQYEPPKDMPPAECGTLIDDKTNPRDITSTLIDLAVRGYLKIREIEEKHLLHTSKDYELQLLKPQDQWSALAPYEQIMLTNVFSAGDTTLVSSLRNRFYVAIPKIKETVLSELDRKGMYAVDPSQAVGYIVFGVIISALPFLAASYLFGANFSKSGVWMFAAIAIAVIVVFVFSRHMTATTLQGSRTKVQVLGFREFLSRVDTDRLKRMPPDTFEKYLAYAMAFGVEEHWAKAFSGIIQNPPSWYQGYYPGGFNTMYFANSLWSMVQTTGSAFVEAPRADSSGSGFGGGGGGFSGGGFGGGGGDAF